MATTVKVLAKELKRTAPDLLEQLKAAGIEKGSEDDSITEKDKTVLLEHLQKEHGSADTGNRKKITLIKRESSEIRQADSAGRTRTVQVEVRKKRVLVKAGDKAPEVEEAPVKVVAPAEPAKPILSAEELEKRAAEATRQAELLARQEAEMKAAEDARQKEADAIAAANAAAPVVEKETKSEDDASAAAAQAADKKAKADKAAKDVADANKAQLADITKRRAAAEAEALAIRDMMSAPARVLKAPSEIAAEEAKKGTLHKPAKAEGADDKKKAPAKVGGKTIKSAETSSTWQEEGAKKPGGLKTRGDSSGGVGGWRSGGGRRKQRQIAEANVDTNFQVPTEPVVRDVHVPETITVAELAHAMAVKSAEVIKLLMGMGQMVTINQILDQDTAMIIVEEMGHTAHAAKLDDPDLDLGTSSHDAELVLSLIHI
jgi:translation initiation factor IF-2